MADIVRENLWKMVHLSKDNKLFATFMLIFDKICLRRTPGLKLFPYFRNHQDRHGSNNHILTGSFV